jgi:NAD(P)-dependent dehydrogenase (short-subunit alcohol dehydrogenase family)
VASWQGKVVLVTGASGGLGLSIADAFAAAGASVVLAARGAAALATAAAKVGRHDSTVLPVVADVTQQCSVESLFAQTLERFGRLDCLVNNAGLSMRRAVLDTTPEDFQRLLDVNLLALVRCTRAAAPHLLQARGHLVNIGSLGGKSAGRFMGAYPAAKFAVSAYTQQLRLELEPRGLHVLLVCPGPIARDEPRPADSDRAKDDAAAEKLGELPASAKKPGAGVKASLIRPEILAARIIRACETRRRELIIPSYARWVFALQQLSPALGDWIVRKMS